MTYLLLEGFFKSAEKDKTKSSFEFLEDGWNYADLILK